MVRLAVAMAAALLMLATTAAAQATTIYVAPGGTGSDSECLNEATPCPTIAEATTFAETEDEGPYDILIAAVDGDGEAAVYEELVHLHSGTVIHLDGGWRGGGTVKATLRSTALSTYGYLSIRTPGSSARNLVADAVDVIYGPFAVFQVAHAGNFEDAAILFDGIEVRSGPGFFLPAVQLHSATGGEIEGSVDVESSGTGGALLITGGAVTIHDSEIRYEYRLIPAVIVTGAASSVDFVRTEIHGPAGELPPVQAVVDILGDAGNARFESSLITGGQPAIRVETPDADVDIVSSTIDAGAPGIVDAGVSLGIAGGTGSLTGRIVNSILIEPPGFVASGSGAAVVTCENSDVPSTLAVQSGERMVVCLEGNAGNTHNSLASLFTGGDWGTPSAYRPSALSPAIDSGPVPAPDSLSETDLLGNNRVRAGRSCSAAPRIDRGAIEAACIPPRFTIAKLAKKKIRRGKVARVVFGSNIPVRVDVKAGRARVTRAIGRWKTGKNRLKLKTKRLKARKKPYKVKVVITDGGGAKVSKKLKLRVR